MSICAGCGSVFHSQHQCAYSGANINEQQRVNPTPSQPIGVYQPIEIKPTYITDILERLTRIEELLREGEK